MQFKLSDKNRNDLYVLYLTQNVKHFIEYLHAHCRRYHIHSHIYVYLSLNKFVHNCSLLFITIESQC